MYGASTTTMMIFLLTLGKWGKNGDQIQSGKKNLHGNVGDSGVASAKRVVKSVTHKLTS